MTIAEESGDRGSKMKPRLKAPPGATDTHMHVYAPGYAAAPTAVVPPPNAPVSAYLKVRERLGLSRSVVVQPSAYAFDNSCTLDAIAALNGSARGIAVVREEADDDELRRLHEGGIRGLRFHMLPGGVLGWESLPPLADRAAELGWHIQVQLDGRTLPERAAVLAALPGTLVIDHVGKFLEPTSPSDPAFRLLLDLVEGGRTYVKLSAPYEVSKTGRPRYEDVGALAKALVKAAPERMLWATNWPHIGTPKERRPDEAELLDLLLEWAPNEDDRRKILVDNPARLYGF
jgi:D-galactarolactone isomerase